MKLKDFIKKLQELPDNHEIIGIYWSEDDIHQQASDMGVTLSDEQVADIVYALEENHDANYGISWPTIENQIHDTTKN